MRQSLWVVEDRTTSPGACTIFWGGAVHTAQYNDPSSRGKSSAGGVGVAYLERYLSRCPRIPGATSSHRQYIIPPALLAPSDGPSVSHEARGFITPLKRASS